MAPGVAVKLTDRFAFRDAEPSEASGAETIETDNGSPSGSLSFRSTGTVTDPPLTMSTPSSRASGERLSGSRTVSTMLDVAVSPSPSPIV